MDKLWAHHAQLNEQGTKRLMLYYFIFDIHGLIKLTGIEQKNVVARLGMWEVCEFVV